MAITRKEAGNLAEKVVKKHFPDILSQDDTTPHKVGELKRKIESYASEDGQTSYWRVVYNRNVEVHLEDKRWPLKIEWKAIVYVDRETGKVSVCTTG